MTNLQVKEKQEPAALSTIPSNISKEIPLSESTEELAKASVISRNQVLKTYLVWFRFQMNIEHNNDLNTFCGIACDTSINIM